MNIDAFKPTPECVNALPDPVKNYIHHLETRCDPAGDVAQLTLIKDQNDQLAAQNEEFQDEHLQLAKMAFEYGYHRNKCIVMTEMRGPTPITSHCDCGWQEFCNKLNGILKDG